MDYTKHNLPRGQVGLLPLVSCLLARITCFFYNFFWYNLVYNTNFDFYNCLYWLIWPRSKFEQGGHMPWNSWKSWKSPGSFFDLEKSLKSIQISQFSGKLSAITGNFRIPLQLQCLCMYKALILFLIHQC